MYALCTNFMKACEKPCRECPFRKESLNGWLGGFTVQETLDIAGSEEPFLCHMTRGTDTAKHKECAGRLLYSRKTCKRFVDPVRQAIANVLAENLGTENILGFDFRQHHEKENICEVQ